MTDNQIYIGSNIASFHENEIKGELITFENEVYYKISNSDNMRPFFMSLVSDSNHWMFISSNGGLTAGRKNSNYALFPYYTDDKITESSEIAGSKTILQVHKKEKTYLWEPFSDRYKGIYKIKRNLYKNEYGNKVIFEEINEDLNLTFRYQWNSSDRFGFVKKSKLINHSTSDVNINLLDGLQNIMPHGVNPDLQNASSNLVDAYKKTELEKSVGLGLYSLSAIIVDKAEPSEALKTNVVWSKGLDNPKYLLSSLQLDDFRRGKDIHEETDIRAEKGAYFISAELKLSPESHSIWQFVTDVNKSMTAVTEIIETIKNESDLESAINNDIELGTKNLIELAAASDALQLSSDQLRNTRHFSNTLFNIMRGGIFDKGYQIEKEDFVNYIFNANKNTFKEKQNILAKLPEEFDLSYIQSIAENDGDANFKRLCFEYLPLKFSRRHGDPSRPWNKFSINTKSEVDGSKILDYEGNWRDIFQNWEALAHSYPEFIESMIHKFLNATTFDGYNPYRVTKGGIDWEVIEEDDPWSYIGYWGDHQIIYLLKFLEFMENYYPSKLASYFNQDMFVYSNVPYKIKTYQETLANPKDTIDFDYRLNEKIDEKREVIGADGVLMTDKNASIYAVNLIEKLLATVLAKVSNFIPEAGIWMNTQRPEWNDANNALVGNGVSMVTLYYLRRFLAFFNDVVKDASNEDYQISEELSEFFEKTVLALASNKQILSGKISDTDRKTVMDDLGNAGSDYRWAIYKKGFTGQKKTLTKADMLQFLELTNNYLEHSIRANKRQDKLYHAYNLMTVQSDSKVSISYLPEMLEGQVAVLSSGYISGKASLELLNALKSSALFRPDQYSYILYPDKQLPQFVDRNNIPAPAVAKSELLKQLSEDGDSQIIEKDMLGNYHFNGNFNNAKSLKEALSKLSGTKYQPRAEKETKYLLEVFEDMFNHKSFTGRSGTFYGYEGLGSIYWHMVSKLLLSVQETSLKAVNDGESEITIGGLLDHYYEINEGIGVHKSPELYGAFPTDAYSHTPGGKGAQQPGMTGQVKEDILSRFGELGIIVKDGLLQFNPRLLRGEEFLKSSSTFKYVNLKNKLEEIEVEKDSLCFTYCQIPIVYKLSNDSFIRVINNDGSEVNFENLELDKGTSSAVFERTGNINHIEVSLKK